MAERGWLGGNGRWVEGMANANLRAAPGLMPHSRHPAAPFFVWNDKNHG